MRKITLAAAIFVAVTAISCAALSAEKTSTYNLRYSREPLVAVYNHGMLGVIASPAVKYIALGQEYPVVRNDMVIGLLRVTDVGKMNIWGAFESSDPHQTLRGGDAVVVTTEPYIRTEPVVGDENDVAGRVVFAVRDGVTVWCVADRGAIDGFRGGDKASIVNDDGRADAFNALYSGRE
jgi:hypothetical protein